MNHITRSLSMAEELRVVDEETALHILLAAPNAELRRLMAFVLRREGHAVVAVKDGGELLEALAHGLIDRGHPPFDVIICDQELPGIPGLSVLAGLRARDRSTAFILITEDGAVQSNAQRLGAVALDRPVTVDGIREAIFRTSRISDGSADLRAAS